MKNKDERIKELERVKKIEEKLKSWRTGLIIISWWLGIITFVLILSLVNINLGLSDENLKQQLQSYQEEDKVEIVNNTKVDCGIYVGEVQYMKEFFDLSKCEVIK